MDGVSVDSAMGRLVVRRRFVEAVEDHGRRERDRPDVSAATLSRAAVQRSTCPARMPSRAAGVLCRLASSLVGGPQERLSDERSMLCRRACDGDGLGWC